MTRIDGYEVLDELPPGSTGRTYLVEDPRRPRKECVVRVLDAPWVLTPSFLNMLEAERGEALGYRHPFAARLHDVQVQPSEVRIVSEMIDGMPLGALLARVRASGGALPWEVVISFGVQVAWALQVAHARPWRPESSDGLVHGRVGPRTLFVTYDGHARLLGVGLGRSRRCLPPSRPTLPYLAPELWQSRRLAPAADVFGLGLTLYDALAGRRTFERDDAEQMHAAIGSEALEPLQTIREDVPPQVDALLRRMAHKVPSERPRDMIAVSRLLQGCLPSEHAGDPAHLVAMMTEHFPDRAALSQRDRARLRRRLGAPASEVAGLRGQQLLDNAHSELQDLMVYMPRTRHIREEPAATPVFDTPSPAHPTITETILLTDPERSSLRASAIEDAPPPFEPMSAGPSPAAAGEGLESFAPPPRLPPPRRPSSVSREEASPGPRRGLVVPVLLPPDVGPELGTLVADRYRITEVLGEGAAAIVYRAEHVLLGKDFALKMLRPELSAMPSVVARFRREAQAVCQLDHPNIVWVSDFGQTLVGALYLVMPLLEGQTLFEVMRKGRLSARTTIEIAVSALAGLEYAHARGLVHRDLKPDNIMIEADQSGLQARLLDFGIAKVVEGQGDGRITQSGMIPGTPAYMAPEQAAGETVDPRADLYALGVVMYEALSGERPYRADSLVALLTKVITEDPAPLSLEPEAGVDTAALVEAVDRAMKKEKAARHDDARAFTEALLDCLE